MRKPAKLETGLGEEENEPMKPTNISESQVRMTQRQLRGLMAFLAIEFILGVTLTTLVNYQPGSHSAIQTAFLAAHIIVAVGLFIGAAIRMFLSLRWRWLQWPSAIGFASMIGAWASGVEAAKSGSGVAVFLMALFFLVTFAAYGYSLGTTTKLAKA